MQTPDSADGLRCRLHEFVKIMGKPYTLSLLIKIGEEQHIDKLQKSGLIYSKTVKYFREREIEEFELRRDKYEGAQNSIRINNLKLSIENKELPFNFQKGRFNTFNHKIDLNHVFCLYAAYEEHANGKPFVDERVANFGNTALLITNPGEFVRRVEEFSRNKFGCSYSLVKYYPDNEDYSKLTVFHKPDYYNFQREFRFHFDHIANEDLVFKIGSIEDISIKIEASKLVGLTMEKK
jgi:hypothetical protein